MKTRYLVGAAAALALLLLHAMLAAVVVDREVAGRLLSAAGWLDPAPLALGAGFLAVRAVVFLVLPGALVLLATSVLVQRRRRPAPPARAPSSREFRHVQRDR